MDSYFSKNGLSGIVTVIWYTVIINGLLIPTIDIPYV